jgi:hypothetical protein
MGCTLCEGPSVIPRLMDFLNDGADLRVLRAFLGVFVFKHEDTKLITKITKLSIEATPAAPADALTFQRFGALRNPPMSERGAVYAKRKSVGLIFVRAFGFNALRVKTRG